MKILITGITGYLGTNLARCLLKEGHTVCGLYRTGSTLAKLQGVSGDLFLREVDSWGSGEPYRGFGEIDAVIHTAAIYGKKQENMSELFQTNVVHSLQVLECALAAATRVFINIDTALPKQTNYYAFSKKQFVDAAQFAVIDTKVQFINILGHYFYGPGDDEDKFITMLTSRCLRNEPIIQMTKGEQRRDFVYIDDFVDAVRLILKNAMAASGDDSFREIEIGSGSGYRLSHIAKLVKRLCNAQSELDFGALPYRKNEVWSMIADTSEIERLGWRVRHDLEAGLRATIENEKQMST